MRGADNMEKRFLSIEYENVIAMVSRVFTEEHFKSTGFIGYTSRCHTSENNYFTRTTRHHTNRLFMSNNRRCYG